MRLEPFERGDTYFCHEDHSPVPVRHLHIMWCQPLVSAEGVVFGEITRMSVVQLCDN